MVKVKRTVAWIAVITAIIIVAIGLVGPTKTARAETMETADRVFIQEPKNAVANDEPAEPYGIYTKLVLQFGGGDGYVWVTVKNKITVFPATVRVYVYLYSSETFMEYYPHMKPEGYKYVADLNMGETIEVKAPTNGESRYWRARTYYQVDNSEWKDVETGTHYCDENGTEIL